MVTLRNIALINAAIFWLSCLASNTIVEVAASKYIRDGALFADSMIIERDVIIAANYVDAYDMKSCVKPDDRDDAPMPWYLVEIDTIEWDFNEAFERGVFTTHGCRNTACAAIFKMQMKNRDVLHQFDNHLIEKASQNQQNSLWIYDEKLARCIDGEWLNSAVTKDCGFKYHLYKARLRYVSLLDTLVIVPNWRMKSTSTNCVVKRKVPQLHLLDVLKVEPFVPTLDKVYIR